MDSWAGFILTLVAVTMATPGHSESLRGLIPLVKQKLAPDREPFLRRRDLSTQLVEVKTDIGRNFAIESWMMLEPTASSTFPLSVAS